MTKSTLLELTSQQVWDYVNQGNRTLFKKHVPDHTFTKKLNFDLQFDSCEIGDLTFDHSTARSLTFTNCKFINHLTIRNVSNGFSLSIVNSKEHCQIETLEVINCPNLTNILFDKTFIKDIKLHSLKTENNQNSSCELSFKDSKVESEFSMETSSSLHFNIDNGDIAKMTLKGTTIGELRIINQSKINKISIDAGKIPDLSIRDSSIDNFDLTVARLSNASIYQSNFKNHLKVNVGNIEMTKFKVECPSLSKSFIKLLEFNPTTESIVVNDLHITGIVFEKVDFSRVQKIKQLRLHNTNIEKELNLCGVDFDYTEFNILNIKKALLKIHRAEFKNLKLVNVEWSSENKAYELDDDPSLKKDKTNYIFQLKNLKESYRVLKVYFLDNHNYFDAMLFATNELRVEQRIKTIETWKTPKSFFTNFGDWFVLSTNKWLSNFGLSWTKPLLLWVFIFHLIPFYFILISFNLGIKPISPFELMNIDLDATIAGFKLYLKLMFPVHDSEIQPFFHYNSEPGEVRLVDIWGVWDFMIRVFASYFIFLIIRGTRKFNFKIG